MLSQVNLYSNGLNIETTVPFTLKNNFLGGLKPNRLGVQGPITLRSLLDAPWPGGNEVPIDQEAFAAKAAAQTEQGIVAFNEQRFGQAYESLTGALDYAENRTTRLYLAYVLNMLGKNNELEVLLEDAVARYPYEVRFFNLAVRNLLASARKEEARDMLNRALKLNPGNPTLENLKILVQD